MEVVLIMFFLFFNNVDILFTELGKLIYQSYNTVEVLSITSKIKLINKKEFVKVILDKNLETFIIYLLALEVIIIYLCLIAQIITLY